MLATSRRILRFRRNPLALFADIAASEPGVRVVPFSLGVQQAVVITSPKPAQQVLTSSAFARDPRPYGPLGTFRGFMVIGDLIGPALPMLDGDVGLARRKQILPGMAAASTPRCPHGHGSSPSAMTTPTLSSMSSLQQRVDASLHEAGDVVDLRRAIGRIVCEEVCLALFGNTYPDWSARVSQALDVASSALHALSASPLPGAHRFDPVHGPRLRSLRRTLTAFATQVVGDLRAKRGAPDAPAFTAIDIDGLSNEALVDEVVTQLVAGTESTSLTCCWLLLLLSTHPDALRAVRADLAVDIDWRGGFPAHPSGVSPRRQTPEQVSLRGSIDALPTVPLGSEHALSRALRETLRLYPSFWQFLRVAQTDTTIVDDTDAADVRRVDVGAGTIAFISPYLAHRDPRVFAEPERFDPWRHQASKALSPELLSFGYGARSCIGAKLAVRIATTTTAAFLHRRDFEFVEQHRDTRPLVFGLNRRGGFDAVVRALAM